MSYVDGIFERYWEERMAVSSAGSRKLSPREIQNGRPKSAEDPRVFFCFEVEQTIENLEARERQIVWWRQPPSWSAPMAWRRISRELGLSHPIPQRMYRRAARRLGEEFRLRKLRPKPRPEPIEETEPSPKE